MVSIILTAALLGAVYADAYSKGATLHGLCPRENSVNDLIPQLSSGANVYFPGSVGFTDATTRWSELGAPNVTVVVEVATEQDVVDTVLYANAHEIPFLAANGGHGAITSLAGVQNGIEIWLNQFNNVSIAADGQTATFQGGVKTKDVSDALWAVGKQTTHGVCECTSLLGPGLGGGHGFLQGHYGLVADQFVELRVVLGNGSVVTVDESSPLYWAMKGAGHNFGIVTSVTSKMNDVPFGGLWSYMSFIFTHDKVEGVFQAMNDVLLRNGTQPVGVEVWSSYFNLLSVDPSNSIMEIYILQQGVSQVSSNYTDTFLALDPAVTANATGTFQDLSVWTSMSLNSSTCQSNGSMLMRFPIDLEEYNITAQRIAMDTFSNYTHQNTAYNGSRILFEGYSLQGVQAVDPNSTAFAHRQGHLLASPIVNLKSLDAGPDEVGRQFGEGLRQILFEGSGQEDMYSYVNYAYGDEGPEAWYGYEPWRLEKLRALKAEYDPDGRFNFYAPFV